MAGICELIWAKCPKPEDMDCEQCEVFWAHYEKQQELERQRLIGTKVGVEDT